MDVGDIDDDGDDDILATLTPDGGQTYVEVFKAQIQVRKDQTSHPRSDYGHFSYIELGQWEDQQKTPSQDKLPGNAKTSIYGS